MTYAMQVKDIHKTYSGGWRKPSKVALKGISLSIEGGETFGFIGPKRRGKEHADQDPDRRAAADGGQRHLV